jgi:hypothetical protein
MKKYYFQVASTNDRMSAAIEPLQQSSQLVFPSQVS